MITDCLCDVWRNRILEYIVQASPCDGCVKINFWAENITRYTQSITVCQTQSIKLYFTWSESATETCDATRLS